MKKNIIFLISMMIVGTAVSQEDITLRFTCQKTNGQYHQFDRVVVSNTTHGWQKTLQYPDTTLTLTNISNSDNSINSIEASKPAVSATYPNPFNGRCSSLVTLGTDEEATIEIVSLTGAVLARYDGHLMAGSHRIDMTLNDPQVAIMRVSTSKGTSATKLYNTTSGGYNSIEVSDIETARAKEVCNEIAWIFDEMLYIAYSEVDGATMASSSQSAQLGMGGDIVLVFPNTQPGGNTIFDENGVHFKTFSVSATSSVRFSMGNLQYSTQGTHLAADGSVVEGTWRFANKQYLFAGTDNTNISSTYTGWIDMFGWATSGWEAGTTACQPYSTTNSTSAYCIGGSEGQSMSGNWTYSDWGVYNAISNGGNQPNMWRTLTKDEWIYLLRTRSCSTVGATANARYAKATVCDVAGLMLFPDTYEHPDGVAIPININIAPTTSGLTARFDDNVYDAKAWDELERAGVIFLPAAGRRIGTSTTAVGAGCFYWSSTGSGSMPYDVSCTDSFLYICGTGDRTQGRTVRLVCDEE